MGWTTCWKCKERFGLADETEAMLRRSGKSFCCPWGHEAVFSPAPTEAEKLRKELDAERRRRQSAEQSIEYQRQMRQQAERSASAYKGQATKLRKRTKAGVCPCCNRTFQQLARHMASQHPNFAPEAEQEGVTLQ